MSNDHPFSHQQDPFTYNAPSPPPQRGSRMMLMMAVVMGVGLLVCGGMFTLAYLAVQKAAGVHTQVELPDELPSRADDQATFNQSLTALVNDPKADRCSDPEVCDFVRTSLADLRNAETMPFSREMFLEAVASSPFGNGQVGLVERLTINTWLADYEPTPSIDEEYETILDVRVNPAGNLATVDLLFYSAESQALSQQWFLVKENDQWKLYDWQRMEYGRRMSDEYAGYVIADTPDAEGYDRAMEELVEAQNLWWDGEEEQARAKLRKCETMPMLAADRTVGLIRTAYTWMSLDQNEETVRVLKMIPNPDEVWGVWPVMAACYINDGHVDEAMEAVLKAEKQSPNHPNVHWLLSVIYEEMDRPEDSADHAVIALQFCPRDPTIYSGVIENDRPEDIPLLLDCMLLSEDEYDWTQVLDHAAASTEWGKSLVEIIEQRDDMPVGMVTLAKANVAWSETDMDTAAELFLKARGEVELPMLRDIANRDHISARMENDRIAELIAEAEDTEEILTTLVEYAMDDELYADPETVLTALEQAEVNDSPWVGGLRGYCNYMLDRYEPAAADFDTFHQWISERNEDPDEEDELQWMVNSAAYYLTDCWVELGKPMEVVDRWPDDPSRHQQWGTKLMEDGFAELQKSVLDATADSTSESIQVQRERLMARVARRQSDAEACDAHHRKAIQLAESVFDDEGYEIDVLIRERADDLVWNRMDPLPAIEFSSDPDNEHRDQFFINAVREAVSLADDQYLQLLIDAARQHGIEDGETHASLQEWLAEHLRNQGRHDAAASALLASVQADTDKDSWRYDQRRHGFLSSSIDANQLERFQQWVQSQDEETVWDRALIAIAAGDGPQIMSILADTPDEEVQRWLSQDEQRWFLERHADQPWMDDLLNRYPIAMGYRFIGAAGEINVDRDELPESEEMEQIIRSAVGTDAGLNEVSLHSDNATARAWLASTEDGQRIAVGFSMIELKPSSAPQPLRERLERPVMQIVIEVIDRQPSATQRLFEAAARVASPQTLSFEWTDGPMLWTGENLAERLRWQGRVPVEGDTMESRLLQNGDNEVDDDSPTLLQWAQQREAAEGGTIPVFTGQSINVLRERLPAQLVDVDVENYDMHVKVEADSHFNPLITTGRTFTTGANNVEKR